MNPYIYIFLRPTWIYSCLLFTTLLVRVEGQVIIQPGTSGVFIPDGQGAYYQGFEKAPANHDLFLCLSSNESKAPGGGNQANPNGFAAGYNFGTGMPDPAETTFDPSPFGLEYLVTPFIDVAQPLALDQVPLVGSYRVLLFDANQTGTDPLLSIPTLEVYTSPTEPVTSITAVRSGNLAYNLDAGTNRTVMATGNTGTSRWNMALYIPDSAFTRAPGGESVTFIHVYTEHLNDNDGFDHWGVDSGLSYDMVPEPSQTLLLLMAGLFAMGLRHRKHRQHNA